jgi:two-component system chemotaxis response regulator CheV
LTEGPEGQATLVFSLGQEKFGVRLETVREISEVGSIAPVPRAPDLIRGLADVRGRMTTVIDLPVLVGAPPDASRRGRLMILSEPRDYLALWTSAEINLLELSGLKADAAQELCEGRTTWEGAPVNVLSTDKILLACEREVLRRYQVL